MSRPRRISRGLIGLLLVVLVLGLLFYLNNVRRSSASESNTLSPEGRGVGEGGSLTHQQSGGPAVAPPIRTAQVKPTVTTAPPSYVTPATQPATRPSRPFALGNSPGPADSTRSLGSDTVASTSVLVQARARKDLGDLLAARTILNDALLARTLYGSDSDAAKRMLSEINQSVFFSPKVFAGDPFASSYTVKTGELLRTIADRHDITWELLARINSIPDPRKLRAGQNIKVVSGPFHAVVTKSRFTVDVYLGPPGESGSLFVTSFPVGLGANDSTPVGSWMVETHKKLKNPTYFSPRGEGVIDADDPKNPLGERWIGLVGIDGAALGQSSYGIHGTIEPQSIGTQASMGCIRMHNPDVELLFDMLVEGKSTVIVRE